MLSWDVDEPHPFGSKPKPMARGSSMPRGSGGGVGMSSRLSGEYGSPPLSTSLSSRRSTDNNPLVKEGLHFNGWSHHVDTGHLNADVAELDASGHRGRLAAAAAKPTSMFATDAAQRASMDERPNVSGVVYSLKEMPPAPAPAPTGPAPAKTSSTGEEWNPFQTD